MLRAKPNGIIKVHPITRHAGTEGEQKFSSIHSLTLALFGVGWSTLGPDRFIPEKRPGAHCTGGCMGPRNFLDGCEKSHLHQGSNSVPFSP